MYVLRIAKITLLTFAATSLAQPTNTILEKSPKDVTKQMLPVIALDYIKVAAEAYQNAINYLSRFSQGFYFSYANVPIDYGSDLPKLPGISHSASEEEASELGVLLLDRQSSEELDPSFLGSVI